MVIKDNIPIEKILSVYDETEADGNFHVCRHLSEDDEFVLFQAISTRGYDDGFYLIPVDSVTRVEVDGAYTKRIQRLFELYQQPKRVFSLTMESLLMQFLNDAAQSGWISSVFFEDGENVTGLILEIKGEENFLCMEKLSEDGQSDGFAYIRIDTIEKIICDSGVERNIGMLKDRNETV